MRRCRRLQTILIVLVQSYASSSAIADVVFNDGAEHVVTETFEFVWDENDHFAISNQTTVRWRGSVQSNGSLRDVYRIFGVSDAILSVETGEIASGGVPEKGVGIDADSGSRVEMTGGTINTGTCFQSMNSQLTISGGDVRCYDGQAPGIGIYATDSQVAISGGNFQIGGGSTANIAILRGITTAEMTGGMISLNTDGSSGGVVLHDASTFTLGHGDIQAVTSDGIHGVVHASDQARFVMTGGQLISDVRDCGPSYGVLAGGDSVTTIQDGSIALRGCIWEDIRSGQWSNGIVAAEAQAVVRIEGGDFRSDPGEDFAGLETRYIAVHASDSAQVELAGGSFHSSEKTMSIVAEDNAEIRIVGHNFDLPVGPILPLNGTIRGNLSNGDPFEFSFDRDATARIVLVPEPTGLCLALIGIAAMLGWRRN